MFLLTQFLSILSVKVTFPHNLEYSYSALPACEGPYAATISETEGKINILYGMWGAEKGQVPDQKAMAYSRRGRPG